MKMAGMSLLSHTGLLMFALLATLVFLSLSFIDRSQLLSTTLFSFGSIELMLLIWRYFYADKDSMPS